MLKKKKKIIFAETNASVGNGHHVSNIENIPVSMKRANIPFAMVTEKNVLGRDFIPFFTPIKEIEDTGANKGVELRRSDYQRFVQRFSKNICFVLSNYSKDLYAWIDVLSDKKYQKIIKENNTLLIIHAVVLYPLFFEHKKIIKQILHDLKGYVFFSFFTSEIAAVAKQIYKSNSFLGMIHPVYDDVYALSKKANIKKKYDFTFWFGGGENLEFHVVDFLAKITKTTKTYKSAVRISPVRDYNYLLLNHLVNNNKIALFKDGMSNRKCIELFSQSKIGVMPYDDFEGSVKASAVFENFILCGVPVLVPKKTWMAEILKALDYPGLSFTAGDSADFNTKLLYLNKNYEDFKIKAKAAATKLYERINTDSFLEKIFALDLKRKNIDFNFYANNINKSRVAKGYAYFYILYFNSLNFCSSKLTANAKEKFKKNIKKYPKGRLSLIVKNVCHKRDLNCFLKNISKYNPSAVAKVIPILPSDILQDKSNQRILRKFIDAYYYCFPVSVLNRVAEYGLITTQVKRKLSQSDFYQDVTLNVKVLLADLLVTLGDKQKSSLLQKQVLNKMLKIKRKTILENYMLASIYFKLGFLDKAKSIYKKVLKHSKSEGSLKGGSCFHIGVISMHEKDKLNALSYFQRTLKFIPLHKKANQYIENLKQAKDIL